MFSSKRANLWQDLDESKVFGALLTVALAATVLTICLETFSGTKYPIGFNSFTLRAIGSAHESEFYLHCVRMSSKMCVVLVSEGVLFQSQPQRAPPTAEPPAYLSYLTAEDQVAETLSQQFATLQNQITFSQTMWFFVREPIPLASLI